MGVAPAHHDSLSSVASGVQILNNTVANSGGHNAIEVRHDEGGPVVRGNSVPGGCVHGCTDLKAVVNAVVDQNIVTNPDGPPYAPAFYTENVFVPQETVSFSRNIAYDSPVGMQIESSGACQSGSSTCAINAKFYNNTIYEASSTWSLISTSCNSAALSFTVENNIIDGGTVDMHSGCGVTWDDNDDGGAQGLSSFVVNNPNYSSTLGPHDVYHVNPQFVAPPPSSPPNFDLQSSSRCIYAGVHVGLPFSGPAPDMGAIDTSP